MDKHKSLTFLLTAGLLCFTALEGTENNGFNAETPVAVATNATFVDIKKSYAFQYPNGWQKDEGLQGFDIFVMAPSAGQATPSPANVSVISGPIPRNVNLSKYFNENIRNLKRDVGKMTVKGNGNAKIGGYPANWIRYLRDDNQTDVVHYFIVANNTGYLITYGATKDAFNAYKPAAERVLKSFRFL